MPQGGVASHRRRAVHPLFSYRHLHPHSPPRRVVGRRVGVPLLHGRHHRELQLRHGRVLVERRVGDQLRLPRALPPLRPLLDQPVHRRVRAVRDRDVRVAILLERRGQVEASVEPRPQRHGHRLFLPPRLHRARLLHRRRRPVHPRHPPVHRPPDEAPPGGQPHPQVRHVLRQVLHVVPRKGAQVHQPQRLHPRRRQRDQLLLLRHLRRRPHHQVGAHHGGGQHRRGLPHLPRQARRRRRVRHHRLPHGGPRHVHRDGLRHLPHLAALPRHPLRLYRLHRSGRLSLRLRNGRRHRPPLVRQRLRAARRQARLRPETPHGRHGRR
mmetsp:Transcript_5033/g.17458  ORF Transcript_5033/g.17458 Transcript_5033/m.17458 type:complete len:324 (-) Transcript_5033:959-1930(-)